MAPQDERDPLTDLFSGVVLPPHDSAQREAIFSQTRPVLQRRRIVRRCAWGTALAACYAVGALSVLAWQSAHPESQLARQSGEVIENHQPAPSQEPAPLRSSDEPTSTIARAEPVAPLSTFEKLRRAGDRQLNERGNLHGAIGCYRRALDFASDDELQIVPERDSWLLIPLKEARLETRKHAHEKS